MFTEFYDQRAQKIDQREIFYEVVKSIPRGRVMTYGAVAALAGFPRCARQVGFALHSAIPCHRVVFKDGSLSPAFAFGGQSVQRKLLEAEGVTFIGDKVCMCQSMFNYMKTLGQ